MGEGHASLKCLSPLPLRADDEVVPAAPPPSINIATVDFLVRGGDQYSFRDAEFTMLGVTDLQALEAYVQTWIGGIITAEDYPVGNEGRIVELTN